MATPADQRLLELMDKWLKSLELQAKYSSLDDDSYWKIQPWVEHQRPSRWIIDLAMQKTRALRAHVQERVKTGDAQYSDSLELMIFLANLVGSEHIERFIPMADADSERPLERAAPHVPQQRQPTDATTSTVAVTATATREMPKFVAAKRAPPAAGTAQVARTERSVAVPPKAAPKPLAKPPAKLRRRPRPSPPRAGRAGRSRRGGCRPRAGHRGRDSLGAMGPQVVRIARTHRADGGPPLFARRTAYTQRK